MAFCYRARTPGPGKTGLFTKCQGGLASLHPKEPKKHAASIYLRNLVKMAMLPWETGVFVQALLG